MNEPAIDIMADSSSNAKENYVAVPFEQLNPDTLHRVISEFVTREWDETGYATYTLEQKIEQVMAQLKSGKAKLVFDPDSNSCNIIPVP